LGAADTKGGIAFSFADWIQAGGIELPRSIVRMRAGIPDGSFVIDEYNMQWSPGPAQAPLTATAAAAEPVAATHAFPATTASSQGTRLLRVMVAIALCALLVVLWLRRDAFMERIGRRLAQDPRAWQPVGDTVFVSAEGMLRFQGCTYRVGPLFYNRPVVVHMSPLFIKASAPGESRTVILARKFSALIPFAPRARGGFTLIESLTASALFAMVIVGAVFPALIVLAQADRIAARHEAALRIAANALTDEEAALAYVPVDSTISDETKVAHVDGMTVSERVAPATVAGLHTLTIDVSDAGGESLARLVTVLGPPVPPPSPSGSPPPGTL
jgi:prepilin-type N-terminal cleavage/methylation domain-containing protein